MQLIRTLSAACAPAGTVRTCAAALIVAAIALPMTALADSMPDLPSQLQEKVKQAQQACSDFENGEFAMEWGAVARVDLDGDLRPDWVLNEASFGCSSAASLYCGTGGCVSHFLVGDILSSVLNQGWDIVDFGPNRVLLTDVHGSQCGGINPTLCFAASTWEKEGGVWRSTAAEWEK